MKILHTADWHLSQLFHEYDRTYEHQRFLNWLMEILLINKLTYYLLVAISLIFPNPSAASIKMFYTFLSEVTKANLERYKDKGLEFSDNKIDRMILGNYATEEEIHNRPLAKLYQDIGTELGLIK